MQIERNELRCFHAVIEAGGFSRAAERLDLSQSAVSQTIANLEHRLGTSLLHRGSPPQPTEAGIRLLRFAETMLNEERETLADIGQIKSGALSTLSLALSPAANSRMGVALLKEFCERNPLTRLKVVVAPSREICTASPRDAGSLDSVRSITICRRTSRCTRASPRRAA